MQRLTHMFYLKNKILGITLLALRSERGLISQSQKENKKTINGNILLFKVMVMVMLVVVV